MEIYVTSPITSVSYDKNVLLKLYQDMLLIRRFEERASQLYGMGLIGGFCHLYNGQEAVVVGAQAVQHPNDTVITAYRDHGHMLACGMDPRGVMAELTGRTGGYSKGKGGSMHMFSREKNFFGGHGIVGAQIPIGTGMAFAHKYKKDGGVCLTYLGDGAANQGQFYESLNMAKLWGLPVVYIVENNNYAMGTSVARHSCTEHFYQRGEGFGVPGKLVDGMDVLAVRQAMNEALHHVRENSTPMIVEMETYRYRGHSMSDPAKYRTKEEVEDYKTNRDPIIKFKGVLMHEHGIKEEEFGPIEEYIKQEIKETVDFAQNSPEPEAHELYTDIYVETN